MANRKPYQKPSLQSFGDIRALTADVTDGKVLSSTMDYVWFDAKMRPLPLDSL
jgi:hypothetical protein